MLADAFYHNLPVLIMRRKKIVPVPYVLANLNLIPTMKFETNLFFFVIKH
jgi:hypothetical protein